MSSLPLGSVPLDSLTQPSAPLPSTWVRALRPSALSRRVRAVATGLLLPAMVVLLWAVAAHAEWVAPQILPDP